MSRTARGFREVVVVLVLLVVGAVSACQTAVPGVPTASADRFDAAARNAFDVAADELAKAPAVRYIGKLDASASGASSLNLTVLRTKQAVGTAKVRNTSFRVVAIGDKLAARATAKGWKSLGVEPGDAPEYAKHYVVVKPNDLGFDPQDAMTPAELATRLRKMVEEREGRDDSQQGDTGHEPVTIVKSENGVQAYRIPLGGSAFVDVTVARPHRIVRISGVELVPGLSTVLDMKLRQVGKRDLKKAFDALSAALRKFHSAVVRVPDFELKQDASPLKCHESGTCRVRTVVRNELEAGGMEVSDVSVEMRATLDGGQLGSEVCTDRATMKPNGKTTLTCSAKFKVPRVVDRVTYNIHAYMHIKGRAYYRPDVDALLDRLERDFDRLMAEVK